MSNPPALVLTGITRVFSQGDQDLEIFRNLDLVVNSGEIVAMVGQSGSGKSSLLHIAGLLERPTAGTVAIKGVDCTSLDDRNRTRIRRNEIGFVYQSHHLLPEFSAQEKRRHPAAHRRRLPQCRRFARQGLARPPRTDQPPRSPPSRAFRRRTATRRHRPRTGQPARPAARR